MNQSRYQIIKKLKILAISDAAPSRNGAGSYYHDLAELLADHVEHIELYSPTIDANGKWHAGLLLPLPGDKTQKLCLPNIFGLNRLVNQIQPDVILIATPGVYGLCGAFLATKKQIPFLLGMHTSFEQLTELYWPDSYRGKIVQKFFKLSNAYFLNRTKSVLVNAQPILEEAIKMGAPDVKLVGTPISSEFIKKEPLSYKGKLEKVLFAGRFAKEKNIDELINTARKMPELIFNFAGDGPLRKDIEEASRLLPNVNYLGWLSRNKLQEAIDSNDALVLASHFETFGTIALEAMVRERIVVVSKGCGITKWPILRPGLKLIDETRGIEGAFKDLFLLAEEDRIVLAKMARKVALQLNEQVLENWSQILAETIKTVPNSYAKTAKV